MLQLQAKQQRIIATVDLLMVLFIFFLFSFFPLLPSFPIFFPLK